MFSNKNVLFTGSPFEGNFLSLNVCQTGTSNNVEFHFTMNISERAIATKQQCDLRWNGLPECAFGDGTCLHNESSPMDKYSVRCLLATEKENYISSIPIMIGPVNDLPLCPPAGKHISISNCCHCIIMHVIVKPEHTSRVTVQ